MASGNTLDTLVALLQVDEALGDLVADQVADRVADRVAHLEVAGMFPDAKRCLLLVSSAL